MFVNSRTTPHRGLTIQELLYRVFLEVTHFGIHLAGWNFTSPTQIERLLWRIASLQLLGVLLFYLIFITIGTFFYAQIARALFSKEATSMLDMAHCSPRWLLLVCYDPVIVAYRLPQIYILLEAFVNLRALPLCTYTDVNRSNFIPHV